MIPEIRRCPRCGKPYTDYPAISRRDNKTEICPECGTAEAFEDYFGISYSGDAYWSDNVDESMLSESPAKSNGIYSLKNGWLKQPERDNIPDEPDLEPELGNWLEDAFHCNTVETIDEFIDNLYKLRQESLIAEGEYGKGNLIFKELRNRGILQGLKDKKVQLENQEMSLTEEKELTEAEQVDSWWADRKNKICEYYHTLMESTALPGEYDRNNPYLDQRALAQTANKFGYGKDMIKSVLKGER